jgi:hypothetical protein
MSCQGKSGNPGKYVLLPALIGRKRFFWSFQRFEPCAEKKNPKKPNHATNHTPLAMKTNCFPDWLVISPGTVT